MIHYNKTFSTYLFSGLVNIKWEEGAPAPVHTHSHTAMLYNGVLYVGGGKTIGDDSEVQFPTTLDTYHLDTITLGTLLTLHIVHLLSQCLIAKFSSLVE